MRALYRALRNAPGHVLLAHSLGCLRANDAAALVGEWQGRIRGAPLVAWRFG